LRRWEVHVCVSREGERSEWTRYRVFASDALEAARIGTEAAGLDAAAVVAVDVEVID
jgi:hypothetical protein